MNAEKEYKFSFTITEANTIITGLHELPVKVAVPIINKIHKQINTQFIEEQKTELE